MLGFHEASSHCEATHSRRSLWDLCAWILLVEGWQALMWEKKNEVIQFIIIRCISTFILIMMMTHIHIKLNIKQKKNPFSQTKYFYQFLIWYTDMQIFIQKQQDNFWFFQVGSSMTGTPNILLISVDSLLNPQNCCHKIESIRR